MLILLSPAKDLSLNKETILKNKTKPEFLEKTNEIHKVLKEFSIPELADLMKLSDKLATLNYQRFQDFNMRDQDFLKACVFAFNGDVYQALNAKSLDEASLSFLEKHLRILSGFYGILKITDLIFPYRLEMGTKLSIKNHKNLYEFWSDILTDYLNNIDAEHILNLASNEYFNVINKQKINKKVIYIDFKDKTANGKYKIISFYAKRARGLMTRFIAINKINSIDGLKEFTLEKYYFDKYSSTTENLVFLRDNN